MTIPHVNLLSSCFQAEYEIGFSRGLFLNGLSVTVLGSNDSEKNRLEDEIEFINIRGNQNSNRSKFEKILNIILYLKKYCLLGLKRRNDIFHTIGLFVVRGGFGALIEALIQRVFFKKWWLTVHNIMPHDAHNRINHWVSYIIYRLPNHLFVHTDRMREQLINDYKLKSKNITVIEHGIDNFIDIDPQAKHKLFKHLKIENFSKIFFQFGYISHYKGLDIFLESLSKINVPSDVLFLIFGKCQNTQLRKTLQTEISLLIETGKNVLWLDQYISTDLVKIALAATDYLILPYRHIDQSGVIFSAKSAGLPIIASDVGAFRNYIDVSDCLVPPESSLDLAKAILEKIHTTDQPNRSDLLKNARERYEWKITLKPYVSLVHSEYKHTL